MMFKIDILEIIKDHFGTLKNVNTSRAGFDDYFTFLFIPIAVSFLLILIGFDINSNTSGIIIGSLSIFVGLLFNALVILLDIARKHKNVETKKIIVNELNANISFSILLAFVSIFIMMFGFIDNLNHIAQVVINFISFFLIIEFLLVFLMVMKRIHLIFKSELNSNEFDSSE